jgi:hypothetical protein
MEFNENIEYRTLGERKDSFVRRSPPFQSCPDHHKIFAPLLILVMQTTLAHSSQKRKEV